MKICELCELENPDEARFCMKCGKDLDEIPRKRSIEVDDADAFIPASASDAAPLGARKRKGPKGPPPEGPVFKPPESPVMEEAPFPEEDYSGEPAEIHLTDVTADFTEQRRFCDRCGTANPRDQRYCRNCGSAMGESDRGDADDSFDSAAAIPLAREPVDTSLLADVAPSSDYHEAEVPGRRRRREGPGFRSALSEWDVREWLAVAIAAAAVAALLWLFAFGGMKAIFNSKADNIRKAGSTMGQLPSYQFAVDATLESSQTGQYKGGGNLVHERPDRDAWDITLNVPGRAPLSVKQIEVGGNPYGNPGTGWQPQNPGAVNLGLEPLWNNPSDIESLGNETVGTANCLHYKYRAPPLPITGMLGIWVPGAVSNAVVEIWIDSASFRVIRQTALVYNVQIEGARTTVAVRMDLAAVGQTYNIQPPM